MTKVSVIVPVYNVEEYLKSCLNSICCQTLEDIEIICIDDGSTDKSPEILDYFAETDERVKVIHKDNGGLSSARNIGLQHATGEYVSFIDSDDAISSVFLECLYTTAVNDNLDICAADMMTFENRFDITKPFLSYGYDTKSTSKAQEKYKLAKMPEFNYVMNKIYKRDKLVKSGVKFREGILYEDIEWSHKVMYYLDRFGIAAHGISFKAIYYYRQRPTSIVATKSEKWLRDRALAHRRTIDFLQSLPNNFDNMREYDWTAMKTYKLCGITLLKIRTCGLFKLYYLFDKWLVFEVQEKRNEHETIN